MTTHTEKKLRTPAGALKRPQYKAGYYLASNDLLADQSFRLQRVRRHNRYLHDWGVVCGLWVVPAGDPRKPWSIQVCPGYAISCCGDEVEVTAPARVDVRDYLWRRPRGHGSPHVTYVGIRYAEHQVRLIPVHAPACGCEVTVYEPSRIRDGFQVSTLWSLPETSATDEFDLCQQRLSPCPECADNPYVLLARIKLPYSEGDPITRDHIDNGSCRPQL